MSNVYARDQKPTELEYFINARALRNDITQYVMNEKNVPKRWRFVHTMPIIEVATTLLDHITLANTTFPSSVEMANRRKEYILQAIGDCEILYQRLDFMSETLQVSITKMQTLLDCIRKEIALLKGWRNATNKTILKLKEKE